MKKALFTLLVTALASIANAQVHDRTLGLRLGSSNFGYGSELSYQHGLGSTNRLELDAGLRSNNHYNTLGASIIYHWVWNISGGFNWYIGPGGQVGFYNHRSNHNHGNGVGHNHNDEDFRENGLIVNIGGQIGIEYDFNEHGVPIQLSLDTRPMWGLFSTYRSGLGYGGALGIRYTF